jgi:hypothetical protein
VIGRFIHGFFRREQECGRWRQLTAVSGTTKNIFCKDIGRFGKLRNGFTVMNTKNVETLASPAGLKVLPERNSDIIMQTR